MNPTPKSSAPTQRGALPQRDCSADDLARRVCDLVIGRAQQACRYALKHQSFVESDPQYVQGWEVAAAVFEEAIRDHVNSHFDDILRSLKADLPNLEVSHAAVQNFHSETK